MTDLPSQKQSLRDHARLHREALAIDDSDFEAVVDVFFEAVKPPPDKIIAAYWPVGKEFNCRFLMDELVKRGFTCALPIVTPDSRVMSFKPWTHEAVMASNTFGILEPQEGAEVTPDIILAPLLAYDQKGYRLGQGGGYYDATIAHLRVANSVQFIGIGMSAQAVLLKLPREAHDIPLDAMLTPQGLVEF